MRHKYSALRIALCPIPGQTRANHNPCMELTFEQIIQGAMDLPRDLSAQLAEQLLGSLAIDEEVDKLWQAEVIRRCEEVDSGAVTAIPGDQVLAAARREAKLS
jgi:putative addiction module component (TIGR02574 family)